MISHWKNCNFTFLKNNFFENKTIQHGLFLTGLALVSWKVLKCLKGSFSYLFTREYNLISRYGEDSWALITGATDGIGKEFAFQLAQRGFNIVLVARNQEKLEIVKAELIGQFPTTKVQIVVANFSDATNEGFFEDIYQKVSDLDISILINNVGEAEINYYHNLSLGKIKSLVILNCLTQALMARVFLPKLASRANGKLRSAIIDVSSQAGEYPRPYLQLYAATKAFSRYLTTGLSYEHNNIDILSLKPGFVETKMTQNAKLDLNTCTKEQCVSAAFRYLGKTRVTNGHWKHQFFSWFLNSLPEPTLQKRLVKNLRFLMQQVQSATQANGTQ